MNIIRSMIPEQYRLQLQLLDRSDYVSAAEDVMVGPVLCFIQSILYRTTPLMLDAQTYPESLYCSILRIIQFSSAILSMGVGLPIGIRYARQNLQWRIAQKVAQRDQRIQQARQSRHELLWRPGV